MSAATRVRVESSLAPVWTELFHADIEQDDRFERRLLGKQWAIMVAIFFLVLIRRLFV